MADPSNAMVEMHCRRCGSHPGHFLKVAGDNLHCIDGLALNFDPV